MSKIVLAFVAVCAAIAAPVAWGDTFVVPHVLEKSGRTSSAPYTTDTIIDAVYAGGLPNWDPSASAKGNCCRGHVIIMKLYLEDDEGEAMRSATGEPVCAPCTFELSIDRRKVSIVLEDLVEEAGGFPSSDAGVAGEPLAGFAVLELEGGDTRNVALQGRVVSSQASPDLLSVFVFEPQPVSAK
jgi:hypothetical protein